MGTTDGGRTWSDLVRLATHLSNFTFLDEREGWATGAGADPSRAAVYHTTDGGRAWTVDLELAPRVYSLGLVLYGAALTLHAGAGAQGLADHTFLYQRSVPRSQPPPVVQPPIVAPDTGTGPAGASPTWWMSALAISGATLVLAGVGGRSRPSANS
jgi:hypothetical protein